MRKPTAIELDDRPRTQLDVIARAVGCQLSTIGDVEQLAGINIQSISQRAALWGQFSYLSAEPPQRMFDAVMDHCASIALKRIARGDLCLIPTRFGES